ncbi:hypothetical protein AX15_004068 [Amanita polypyramis BW_CC]|nr:hypothetical protein AX15_004068 [Amanita polypyramis BW_CC]
MYEEDRFSSFSDDDEAPPEYTQVARDYIKLLNCLLNGGAGFCPLDRKCEGPLHYAARNGNPFAVKFTLKNGAEANMTNTSLHLAVTCRTSSLWSQDTELLQKHIDYELTVKHLLIHDADVNARV